MTTLASSMTTPPTIKSPKITPDELLRMPDSQLMELVDGEIVEKMACLLSSKVELLIAKRLSSFADTNASASVFPASLGYRCFPGEPNRIRKPDVTVVTSTRLGSLENPNPGFMPIIPDLAVEVFSQNDFILEMSEKVLEYRAAGFPLVWAVDPFSRMITVYPNPGKAYLLTEEDDIRCENALTGFSCKVAELFPPRI